MATSTRAALPVAIVVDGNLTMPGHYERFAESLTANLAARQITATSYKESSEAVEFLDGQPLAGACKGVLLFVSGAMLCEADEIATRHPDFHVVVLTGRHMPEGRPLNTKEDGRAVLVDKNDLRTVFSGNVARAIMSEFLP